MHLVSVCGGLPANLRLHSTCLVNFTCSELAAPCVHCTTVCACPTPLIIEPQFNTQLNCSAPQAFSGTNKDKPNFKHRQPRLPTLDNTGYTLSNIQGRCGTKHLGTAQHTWIARPKAHHHPQAHNTIGATALAMLTAAAGATQAHNSGALRSMPE